MKKKQSDRHIRTVKLTKEATDSANRIIAAKKHADEQWRDDEQARVSRPSRV